MTPRRKDQKAEYTEPVMGEPEELEATPEEAEANSEGQVILSHSLCYCYTEEYLTSVVRKILYSVESQGSLRLTNTRLIYRGGSATINIPIKAMTAVSVQCFPWYHTYSTSNYLRIDTLVKGKPTFFGFVPFKHMFSTVMTTNDIIYDYYNKIHFIRREMAADLAAVKKGAKGKKQGAS